MQVGVCDTENSSRKEGGPNHGPKIHRVSNPHLPEIAILCLSESILDREYLYHGDSSGKVSSWELPD